MYAHNNCIFFGAHHDFILDGKAWSSQIVLIRYRWEFEKGAAYFFCTDSLVTTMQLTRKELAFAEAIDFSNGRSIVSTQNAFWWVDTGTV